MILAGAVHSTGRQLLVRVPVDWNIAYNDKTSRILTGA